MLVSQTDKIRYNDDRVRHVARARKLIPTVHRPPDLFTYIPRPFVSRTDARTIVRVFRIEILTVRVVSALVVGTAARSPPHFLADSARINVRSLTRKNIAEIFSNNSPCDLPFIPSPAIRPLRSFEIPDLQRHPSAIRQRFVFCARHRNSRSI